MNNCKALLALQRTLKPLKDFLSVLLDLVSELCKDFENGLLNSPNQHTDIKPHHAESPYLQERFLSDNKLLYNTIITQGNPFSKSQVEKLQHLK
jgi:hypothetical protein